MRNARDIGEKTDWSEERKNFMRNAAIHALISLAAAFMPATAFAANQVVWQIGKFDKSTMEFPLATPPGAAAAIGQTSNDLVYTVGKNHTEDWPRFQPGSSNGLAGYREHPYAIDFDLPMSPRGLYTLKIALLVKTPRVAQLRLTINGHRALYFQHPVLDYNRGDDEGFYMPNYSADTVIAQLPTEFLRRGMNELILTAVDDASARDDVTNSGIYYDALKLKHDPAAQYSYHELSIDAQPTTPLPEPWPIPRRQKFRGPYFTGYH
jgi:alpha-mannosidase